jgi:hypothetical protein
MATYQMEIDRYPYDEHDEDDEPIPGKVAGYHVFSTIRIGKYTFVRAVVENKTGQAPRSNARIWFVEWQAKFDQSSAHQRMTKRMTRAEALKEGERLAALVGDRIFADLDEVTLFYANNHPSGPTY